MAPRADGVKNAALLLAAARELFEEHGPEAALDQIARRAGVGNATLYRHFPTRADLLIAVYEDDVAALCAKGESLLSEPSATEALFAWLDLLATHIATKRALAFTGTERRPEHRTALFDRWHDSIRATAERLLDRARDTDALRPDFTVGDILTLTSAAASAATDADHALHLVRIICHGMEADGQAQ